MICFALPLRTKSAYLGKQPSHMVSLGRPNLSTSPLGGWDLDLGQEVPGLAMIHGTHLLDAVEKCVPNIPFVTISDLEPPGQLRLVEIDEQADGQVPHLDLLVVETAAGGAKKGRQSRQELGQVAEARDRGDEGGTGSGLAGDVKGHAQAPESLRDARTGTRMRVG